MTTDEATQDPSHPAERIDGIDRTDDGSGNDTERAAASRQWRGVWRIHFYSGMFAMPFILLMAVTGLVILYTQPLQDLTQGDLRTVEVGSTRTSYDDQVAAVVDAFPDATVMSLTVPTAPDRATIVGLDSAALHGSNSQAFVDPYTGKVVGTANADGGVIGLSNRLHGYLNVESMTVPLPAVNALWDDGPVLRDYVLFDLVLEILGVWTLVLIASGLFLFWPRRRQANAVATQLTSRGRWRRLHGWSGAGLVVMMVVTIISGMAWSTYWGTNFSALADEVTPGKPVDIPNSVLGQRGDLDVLGNKINWNTGDFPIPPSYAPADKTTDVPAPMSLDDIVLIAEAEGMKSGYSIYFPENVTDPDGMTLYGAFTVSNSWPRKTGEARDVFIDQFSGETLAEQEVYGAGALSYGMDVLVSTHMGTQLGVVSRILMTALCVLSIWSVFSAAVMFWKRRRPGTLGLPRRPADVRLTRGVIVAGSVLAIVFPQWALTALIVLAVDRFVIRRTARLRLAFGQR